MKELSAKEKQELEELYQSYYNHPLINKMKEIPMHRGSNCFIHSFKVCKMAVHRALKRKGEYNLKDLITASVLHDYYLYDWRKNHELKKKHGKRHPLIAEENARRDFHISDSVSDIIKTHMWPLTPGLYPKTKEAKLVNYVDDVIATREFMVSKHHKKVKEEKYLKNIERLFDE